MRNLKTLGMALVAMFAMSVLVASAAHAANFTATKAPAIITGEQEGTENFFEVPGTGSGVKVECTAPKFDGTASSTSQADITITPTYEVGGKCTTSLGTTATIDMNGCHYTFTIGAGSGDTWNGTVDLLCGAGKQVVVTTGPCNVTIAAQANIGGIVYTDITNANKELEDVTLDVNSTLDATVDNVFLCPFSGAQKARYVSKVTVKGFIDEEGGKKEGAQTGVTVD